MAVHGISKPGTKQVKVPAPSVVADYSAHLGEKAIIDTLHASPITGGVSHTQKHSGEPQVQLPSVDTTIVPGVFSTNGMKVGVMLSRTINLGNFESAKVEAWVEVPCDPATLNEAYEFGSEWVSGKIAEAEKAAKGIPTT